MLLQVMATPVLLDLQILAAVVAQVGVVTAQLVVLA
jgi:hypothetical protein